MFASTRQSLALVLSILLVALFGTACEEDPNPLVNDAALTSGVEVVQNRHNNRAPQASRQFYLARIEPEGGSRARGVAQFEIVGGYLTAKVRVAGVAANQRIPQHIHLNPTCSPPGGILINLDEYLTVAGEGPPVGDAYPRANRGGVLQYDARRSLEDLRQAINYSDAFDVYLHSVEELINWLDLGNRNVNIHEPAPPPIPPVGCGGIERIN